jgi:hypothetical protein
MIMAALSNLDSRRETIKTKHFTYAAAVAAAGAGVG